MAERASATGLKAIDIGERATSAAKNQDVAGFRQQFLAGKKLVSDYRR
jgi:hypothetical protein